MNGIAPTPPQDPKDFLWIDVNKIKSIGDIKLIINLLTLSLRKDHPMLPFMIHLCKDEDLHKYHTLN